MNNQLCERMRTHYPPGTRVQLLRMDDPYAPRFLPEREAR